MKACDSKHYFAQDLKCGKLILTNQRLYFKCQDHSDCNLEIMPADIEEVLFFNTHPFSSNGLNIVKKDGTQLKFRIKQRNAWGKAINQMY